MDAITQHKRNRLYNQIDSAIFAAQQAAAELARMDELKPVERETARKFGQGLNGYNKKIMIFRRAQHLSAK